MKIKIHYDYDPRYVNKYWASAQGTQRGSTSWEEAKESLIVVLKQYEEQNTINIPPDEEVDL